MRGSIARHPSFFTKEWKKKRKREEEGRGEGEREGEIVYIPSPS